MIMKNFSKILALTFILIMITGCMEDNLSPLTDLTSSNPDLLSGSMGKNSASKYMQPKITGGVEFDWMGGKGMGTTMGNQPEDLLAFAEFEAFLPTDIWPVKGSFTYRVLNTDLIPHRVITAEVTGVFIGDELKPNGQLKETAWIVGKVISDTKGCAGNGQGGHDPGCQGGTCSGHDIGGHDEGCSGSDGGDHTDGGCSGTDHTDGGCSGSGTSGGGMGGSDSGTSGGGCTDTTHEEGCSGEHETGDSGDTGGGGCTDSTHEEGCSGDHGSGDSGDMGGGGCTDSTHEEGCSGDHGSGGSGGMGNEVKGKNCRIGQIIAVKCHDGATPGADGDGITWKWFSPTGTFVPSIDNKDEWPHLCKKTILEGNIMLHP
jgi:hypothetical protein